MPTEITVTDRDQKSYMAQMAQIVGDPNVWLRIDKCDGSIVPVNGVAVVRAASGSFKKPDHAIATGRFATPFAIYCTADRLTNDEREMALGIAPTKPETMQEDHLTTRDEEE